MADAPLNIIIGTLTQAQASASSLVLRSGQGAFTSDTRRVYYGDGASTLATLVAERSYLLPFGEFRDIVDAELAAQSAVLTAYADAAATSAETNSYAYTDSLVAGAFRPAGSHDASLGSWPTAGNGPGGAVRAGDVYKVSAAGILGSYEFDKGDSFYAITDAPGQDEARWERFEQNDSQATESYRGTLMLSTETQAIDGTDDTVAVTPLKWWQAFVSAFSTVGLALRLLPTPAAPRWLRINSAGTVSMRSDSETRSDLGLGDSATKNVGAGAGTVCAGDDARLSDARTPTAHTHTASEVSDSTAAGRALITAADAPAQRAALGIVSKAGAPAFTTSGAGYQTVTGANVTLKANTTYSITIYSDTRSTNASSAPNVSVSCTNSPTIALFRQQGQTEAAVGHNGNITANDGGTTYVGSGMATATPLRSLIWGIIVTGVSDSVLTLRLARGGANNVSIEHYAITAIAG